jgi:hypothetical protein
MEVSKHVTVYDRTVGIKHAIASLESPPHILRDTNGIWINNSASIGQQHRTRRSRPLFRIGWVLGKFSVFQAKHWTRFEVRDGVKRGAIASIAYFNGDRYDANTHIGSRENLLSIYPRSILYFQSSLRIRDGYVREVVSTPSFDAVKYQARQRQYFNDELRISNMSFQAVPQIAKILICFFGALIFLALGLVHVRSIAPSRWGLALVGFLAIGVVMLFIGAVFVFFLDECLAVHQVSKSPATGLSFGPYCSKFGLPFLFFDGTYYTFKIAAIVQTTTTRSLYFPCNGEPGEPFPTNLLVSLTPKALFVSEISPEYKRPLAGPIRRPCTSLLSLAFCQRPRHTPRMIESSSARNWLDRRFKMEGLAYQRAILNPLLGCLDFEMHILRSDMADIIEVNNQLTLIAVPHVQINEGALGAYQIFLLHRCLLLNLTERVLSGLSGSAHLKILQSRVVDGDPNQEQSENRYSSGEYDGMPIGPIVGKKSRATISSSLLARSLLCGFCGFWLVYASVRVEDVGIVNVPRLNIPRIAVGFAFIAPFWIVCHAALDILDFG